MHQIGLQTRPVVAFRHVTRDLHAGGIRALSFEVSAGEVYVILGGPGSGKTAVADLILGFGQRDQGVVEVLDVDPETDRAQVRRAASFIDGRGRLAGAMTPLQNLEFLVSLTSSGAGSPNLLNVLRKMGVPDRSFNVACEMLPASAHISVMLSLAWIRRSTLLVMDEPTAGFDSVASAAFVEALDEFRHIGTTVVLTTGDVLLAARAADHVAILKGGHKVAERHRHQILQESLTALYADYIGHPASRDKSQ